LTVFGLDINEVAVAIQLGAILKNNQTGAKSQKRAIRVRIEWGTLG